MDVPHIKLVIFRSEKSSWMCEIQTKIQDEKVKFEHEGLQT